MQIRRALTGSLLALVVAGCSQLGGARPEHDVGEATRPAMAGAEESEETLRAEQFPGLVREAALGAVPGLVITGGELDHLAGGRDLYCVHGTKDGACYEIEVTPEGKVHDVETGDEDEGSRGARDDDEEEAEDDDRNEDEDEDDQ